MKTMMCEIVRRMDAAGAYCRSVQWEGWRVLWVACHEQEIRE